MTDKKLDVKDTNYSILVDSIGVLLEQGRKQAYQAVNQILVQTYWDTVKE